MFAHARGDTNSIRQTYQILSLARLPISPPWRFDYRLSRIAAAYSLAPFPQTENRSFLLQAGLMSITKPEDAPVSKRLHHF